MGFDPREVRAAMARLGQKYPADLRGGGGGGDDAPRRRRRGRRAAPKPPAPPPDMRTASAVLSIDPSIRLLGWAVLAMAGTSVAAMQGPYRVDSGTWHPSASRKMPGDRWQQLYDLVVALRFKFPQIGAAVIEQPNPKEGMRGHRDAKGRPFRIPVSTLITYGRAVGVVEAAMRSAFQLVGNHVTPAPVYVIDVNTWKGMGKKAETQRLVSARLGGYVPKDDNESDALGLGLWYLDRAGRPPAGGS